MRHSHTHKNRRPALRTYPWPRYRRRARRLLQKHRPPEGQAWQRREWWNENAWESPDEPARETRSFCGSFLTRSRCQIRHHAFGKWAGNYPKTTKGRPSRDDPYIVSSGSREPRKRSGRLDLRKTNDPVSEPHGPQVMTMRHWITSFRKNCCDSNIGQGVAFDKALLNRFFIARGRAPRQPRRVAAR